MPAIHRFGIPVSSPAGSPPAGVHPFAVAPAGQTSAPQSAPSAMSPPAQQGALSAQQPPDPLTQLTNDIRLWKMATLVLGTGVVYLAASAWWRGRTAHKLLKELEGAKSESAKRAAAIAAAKHALG